MPRKNGRLSPQEQRLIPAFVATGDVAEAGRRAGYAHTPSAHNALARPEIRGEVMRQQLNRLTNEVLPLALDRLVTLLTDPKTPHGAQATAVNIALKYAVGDREASGGKEPHEMTADELAQEIDRLRSIKADKARPVLEAEPIADVFA